jgi:plasmid stabilization system protein ParE
MKIFFSSVFEADFTGAVAGFAQEASPVLATRFESRVIEAYERIVKHPEIGRRRKDINRQNIRSFRVAGFDNYLIFYQVRPDGIVFVRLLHGAMDLPAFLPES